MKAKKVGFSYIRFSRAEQAQGDSLRRQTTASAEWCKRNGVTLDTSVTFHALGTSAFSGKHRDNPDKYALAQFCELVKSTDRIPRDSYLIVESLDRLTREHVRTAVKFLLDLLDHGINIVTTSPERVYRHDSTDMIDIITAVVELARGHGESALKSERVGAAWRERKKDAIHHGVPITAMCPHWLKVVEGKYVVIPERAKLIQQMYADAIAGVGVGVIVRRLNEKRIKPFGKHRHKADKGKPHLWQKSSVGRILKNRAVLGEYQPHIGNHDRKPDGEPVAGYYPRIITEAEFHRAQLALQFRRRQVLLKGYKYHVWSALRN